MSFLGVGVPAGTASWGRMITEGREVMIVAWWPIWLPGLALLIISLTGNLMGTGYGIGWIRGCGICIEVRPMVRRAGTPLPPHQVRAGFRHLPARAGGKGTRWKLLSLRNRGTG